MIAFLPLRPLSEVAKWPSELRRLWTLFIVWASGTAARIFQFIFAPFTPVRVLWKVSQLPGPPAKFLWGHSDTFLSMHRFMDKVLVWRNRYPICQKAYMMFYPLVFVYAPEGVQEILSKRQKHNDKGAVYHTLLPLLGDGLITSKGAKWFSHRRMITPTFHFNILECFFEVFKERTRDYIKELRGGKITQEFVDLIPMTSSLTLSFICETAMGLPIGVEKSEQYQVIHAMHKLEEIAVYRGVYPWLLSDWIFKWTRAYKVQEYNRELLHRFTDQIIQRRRQELLKEYLSGEVNIERKRKPILIDLLMEQAEMLRGESLTDQEIREEVNTFMFAGHKTTQLAINYCIFLLGNHPEIQAKAREEVDEIFGNSDRDPTIQELNQLKYVDCCIKEALRLYPSVPLILRKVSEDQPVGSYVIPKGVDCVILPYVIHRDPSQYSTPHDFNPDHFSPENSAKRHPYSYIPFSAGPRNCIGKKFANLAVKIAVSWILREFTIESEKRQSQLKLLPNTVLVPLGGLKVKLTPRQESPIN